MRTPEIRRVRTKVLARALNVPANQELVWENAFASYQWQDDVRVIGAELSTEIMLDDIDINADGMANCIGEISRTGHEGLDGVMLSCRSMLIWHGVFCTGGDQRKTERVMFPEGHGIDYDEGESIYLNAMHQSVGATTTSCYYDAIIYYVER